MLKNVAAMCLIGIFSILSAGVLVQYLVPPVRAINITDTYYISAGDGHGSGFHIGGGYVVTAAHVASGAKGLSLISSSGKVYTPEVMWINKNYDVALLRADLPGNGYRLNCDMPAVGDQVHTSGSPQSLKFTTSYGRVSSLDSGASPSAWRMSWVADMQIVPGQSGGPVFNENNEVIGIAVGYLSIPGIYGTGSHTGYGIVVPGAAVCKLLGKELQ